MAATSKERYILEFDDHFETPYLDPSKWLPFYLPQWSSRERAAARYSLGQSALSLSIEADQEPWCPEFDGAIRVSSIQTGCFAGARGSEVGQHRFTPRLVVREEQPLIAHYTPLYGRIETRLKAVAIPGYMVAMWMIGFEREPSQSAEICICEIFGSDVNRGTAMVGYGVHPFADPAIRDEFYRDAVEMDATQFHVYAIDWTPDHIEFSLDGSPLRRISQSPDYPMQLMLGIYEIPAQITEASAPGLWPKTLEVDYVRGYRATRATPGPDRR